MMICSAPRRPAAITPHKPTAPSPTTATVLPGPTSALRAAWWPVAITSESVSSDGISASSLPTGRTTSVPSAWGTRTASPWPPSTPSAPYLPPWRHEVCSPPRQKTQVPSDHTNGVTTTSPAFRVCTSSPTDSTTPMNSCPMRRPVSLGSIDLYGHRSLPQIAAQVTTTTASVGSISPVSGTVSTRTSPAPYMTVARIVAYLSLPTMRSPPLEIGGAAAYSSSVTCLPHVAGLPSSSTSSIARWVIKRLGAAPCQWSS